MMTFNLTLTPAVLSELTNALSKLAAGVTYKPGTPGTLNIDNSDPANEPTIVDLVASMTKTADIPLAEDLEPINWGDLARAAAKAKRLATFQERDALAAIARKRRLQEAAA